MSGTFNSPGSGGSSLDAELLEVQRSLEAQGWQLVDPDIQNNIIEGEYKAKYALLSFTAPNSYLEVYVLDMRSVDLSELRNNQIKEMNEFIRYGIDVSYYEEIIKKP